jgi:hypothetical protein
MPNQNDPNWRPDELPRDQRDKSRYDPENEIPDPDEVEQDIKEAEKSYRKDEKK